MRTTPASAHASGGADPASSTTPRPSRWGGAPLTPEHGIAARLVPDAIWSLCVSCGDLVTLVFDIENLGDQIGL